MSASLLAAAAPAHADLVSAPTGSQIAVLAKRTVFNPKATFSPSAGVQVTPTAIPITQLPANGKLVALIRNQRTLSNGLAPGQHHIYVARIAGSWRALAEANGRIVAQNPKVVLGNQTSEMRGGMCFGWYECHNGQCVCYGIVWKGTPF